MTGAQKIKTVSRSETGEKEGTDYYPLIFNHYVHPATYSLGSSIAQQQLSEVNPCMLCHWQILVWLQGLDLTRGGKGTKQWLTDRQECCGWVG